MIKYLFILSLTLFSCTKEMNHQESYAIYETTASSNRLFDLGEHYSSLGIATRDNGGAMQFKSSEGDWKAFTINHFSAPPPEYFELVKSFIDGNLTDTIRGWKVEFIELFSLTGYTEGVFAFDIKATYLNKQNEFLPVYYSKMNVSYGNGYDLKIYVTDEEMQRRANEILKSNK